MGLLLIALVGAGGFYLATKGGTVPTSSPMAGAPSGSAAAASSAAINGAPGTVTVGGSPPPSGWTPGSAGQQTIGLATTGLAGVAAVNSAALSSSSGFLGIGGSTALGGAVPFIGLGIAAAGIVLAMIKKHHAEAVKREADGLNAMTPACIQHYVLTVQACITGDIKDIGTANGYLQQGIDDFYTGVRSIIKGKWPCQGNAGEIKLTSIGVVGDPAGDGKCGHTICARDPQLTEWHLGHPDPCNGPCVDGHILDGFRIMASATCGYILQGKHDVMVFKQIPAHAGFSGMPEVRVSY